MLTCISILWLWHQTVNVDDVLLAVSSISQPSAQHCFLPSGLWSWGFKDEAGASFQVCNRVCLWLLWAPLAQTISYFLRTNNNIISSLLALPWHHIDVLSSQHRRALSGDSVSWYVQPFAFVYEFTGSLTKLVKPTTVFRDIWGSLEDKSLQ